MKPDDPMILDCPKCKAGVRVPMHLYAPIRIRIPRQCRRCKTSLKLMVGSTDQDSVFFFEERK